MRPRIRARARRVVYTYPDNISYIGPRDPGGELILTSYNPCAAHGHDWPSRLTAVAYSEQPRPPEQCPVCKIVRKQV